MAHPVNVVDLYGLHLYIAQYCELFSLAVYLLLVRQNVFLPRFAVIGRISGFLSRERYEATVTELACNVFVIRVGRL